MFQQTINLGKELRPKALWGFYGFPDCYGNKENHYQCGNQVSSQILCEILLTVTGVITKGQQQ